METNPDGYQEDGGSAKLQTFMENVDQVGKTEVLPANEENMILMGKHKLLYCTLILLRVKSPPIQGK